MNKEIENLITDNQIKIVFGTLKFGHSFRKQIEIDLPKIAAGEVIGGSSKTCLIELGLIKEVSFKQYALTQLGERYIDLLSKPPDCQSCKNEGIRGNPYDLCEVCLVDFNKHMEEDNHLRDRQQMSNNWTSGQGFID